MSPEEIAEWRDKLPELQLPDLALGKDNGAGSLEPQAARQLIKKQNALREVEHLKEQLFKAKMEMCQNAKKSSDLNEKLRTQGAGNQIRQQYLAEVEEKTIQWKKMTSDLRRRLVSAGARSSKMSGACEKQERVAKACSEIEKVQANLVENMLDDDIAMLQKRSSAVDVCLGSPIPIEAKEIVEKLSGDFTVSEIGASLLSNLNKFVIFSPQNFKMFFFHQLILFQVCG